MPLSNDKDVAAQIYRSHHGWLVGWLRLRLGNQEWALDIAQDTFVRLLSRRDETPQEPRAYLTTIAKRLMVDHYRRQTIEQAYSDAIAHLPQDMAPSPEEGLLIRETLLEIDRVLGNLSERTRTIFLMSQVDGMIYADIAAKLDISLPTVKRHMFNAARACMEIDLS